MKRLLPICIVTALACCTQAGIWIPLETTPRPQVPLDHVQYLEAAPDKPHVEIGVITPPAGEYDTFAELIHAVRVEAARRGADAIYIESATEQSGWKFRAGSYGASGGSFEQSEYRAKAIVWR